MYRIGEKKRRKLIKTLVSASAVVIILAIFGVFMVNSYYQKSLYPVDSNAQKDVYFTVRSGMSPRQVAQGLKDKGLVRNSRTFYQYIKTNELGEKFTAGTYKLRQSMTAQEIAKTLIDGEVATDLFTIIPGTTIGQIKKSMIATGQFSEADVESAFNPSLYKNHPALVDLPAGASLEGFLYPDSYQFIAETMPGDIISQALDEMARVLTPDIRAGISNNGLSVYQGIIVASIVEREVGERGVDGKVNDNRAMAAQVFLSRLKKGMKLESNATDGYPAEYDTYRIDGLPPEPISNVSSSALDAVAKPSLTNYLFFVSGKDCVTRFSETNEQHEQLITEHGVATADDHCQ